MKILRLKAKNINSLKGDTDIDFEDFLQDSALFGITGPTGSGKSTLLDIITCALYGRTPRLNNPSDLMSRHCGEALCEVEFEVKSKIYRSVWTQKRARNKADGKLQQATMELSDVLTEKVLESKVSRVPKFIEELTGLDFDRFSQSMMLAQGSFDAFLKAKEGERSALLEKITGTKIYAQISQRVYEKYSEGKQAIELDTQLLGGMELMDAEVLKEKTETLALNKKAKLEEDQKLKTLNLALNWSDTLSKLTLEKEKYEQAFREVSQAKEAKKEDFLKLEQALKALSLSTSHTQKMSLENNLKADETSLAGLTTELKELATQIVTHTSLSKENKVELELAKKHFDTEVGKLKQAREIQTQEQEKTKAKSELDKTIETKTASSKMLNETLVQINETFTKLSSEVAGKNEYLKTHSKDEKLISTLALIGDNLEKYTQAQTDLNKLLSDKAHIDQTFTQIQSRQTVLQAEYETLAIASKKSETAYDELQSQSSKDVTDEPQRQIELKQIEKLSISLKSYRELLANKDQELKVITDNNDKEKMLSQTLTSLSQQIQELKAHIETLRVKKDQELLIQKYEVDRAKLVEGEACFLCGSLEHPSVEHAPTNNVDETSSSIVEKSSQLQSLESELKTHEAKLAHLKANLESSHLEVAKLDKSLETLMLEFKLADFTISQESEANLFEKQNSIETELKQIIQRRESRELLLKQRDADALALKNKEQERSMLMTEHTKQSEQIKQFETNEKAMLSSIESLTTKLTLQYKEYDLSFDKQNYELQVKELFVRRDTYVRHQEELKVLEKELALCNIKKTENETALASLTAELKADTNKANELDRSLKELHEKRIVILNVAHLDNYEQEIHTNYKAIETKAQTAIQELQALSNNQVQINKQKVALETKINKDKEQLVMLSTEFNKQLEANDFENLEAFRSASMENEARQALELSCKAINEKFNETKTLKEQALKQLQEHQKTPQSDKPISELKEEQEASEKKVDELQISIGRDEKELELNHEKETKHKDKIASLNLKKEAFKVWQKMQELIGSADGAKFAKFAQGITLDQLIKLANHHLNILSQRYTLVRGQEEKQLLEIEIIDSYQGNVIRPVSTLSGGESFIVSLALALGLSELASQKISIDSLFLDEGFGTLDPQSLDMALNALSLLQDSGKMVGVISHVEALKERIPLQIKVIPKGDGTSFVEVG